MCATVPQANPSAALDRTIETAVQTIITNDYSFEFMSLEAIANSIPENSSSTPSNPTENCTNTFTRELPNTNPSTNLAAPNTTTHPLILPPNFYCPAPGPWHMGIAPDQHPTTLTDTDIAESSFPEKRSDDNFQTAITELGICGIAPLMKPVFNEPVTGYFALSS